MHTHVAVTELSIGADAAPGVDLAGSGENNVVPAPSRNAADADAHHRRQQRGRWNNEMPLRLLRWIDGLYRSKNVEHGMLPSYADLGGDYGGDEINPSSLPRPLDSRWCVIQ